MNVWLRQLGTLGSVSYTHLDVYKRQVEICLEACKAAKAHGVKISCDLNYRGKLWTREQAREAMTKLGGIGDIGVSGIGANLLGLVSPAVGGSAEVVGGAGPPRMPLTNFYCSFSARRLP